MNKKNYVISILRLLAFCMIVSCHICQHYGNEFAWWLNCGVQIFLLISGFLYGQKENVLARDFYKRNAAKILIDYYIFLVIILPIYIFVFHSKFLPSDFVKFSLGLGTRINGLGHLWYISIIVVCYGITPLVLKFLRPLINVKYILVVCFSVEALCVLLPGLTGAWINCYILGMIIGNEFRKTDREEFYARLFLLVTPLMLVLNGIEIYIKYIGKIEFIGIWGKIGNTFFHYGHIALALFIFSGIMTFVPISVKNKEKIKLLDFSDKYSYDAYLVHLFFILGPCSYFTEKASFLTVVGGIAFLIPTVIVCAVCLKFLADMVRRIRFC